MKVKKYITFFFILFALGLVTLTVVLIIIPSINTTDENGDLHPLPSQPTPTPALVLAPPLNRSETLVDEIFLSLEWEEDRMCVILHNNTSDFGIVRVDHPPLNLEFFDGSDWWIAPIRRQGFPNWASAWQFVRFFPGESRVNATIYADSIFWGRFFPLPHDVLHRARIAVTVHELPEGWHEPYVYECPEIGTTIRGSDVLAIRREDLDHDIYIEFYWPQAYD